MSNQPHVWVVEQKYDRWVPRSYHRLWTDAKQHCSSLEFWYKLSRYRVAKYVRVEPKKKRSKP